MLYLYLALLLHDCDFCFWEELIFYLYRWLHQRSVHFRGYLHAYFCMHLDEVHGSGLSWSWILLVTLLLHPLIFIVPACWSSVGSCLTMIRWYYFASFPRADMVQMWGRMVRWLGISTEHEVGLPSWQCCIQWWLLYVGFSVRRWCCLDDRRIHEVTD